MNNFKLEEAITMLAATPAALRGLLANAPEPWIHCDEGPNTFSAFDNVGHLIHAEKEDWIPRARIILAQGENRTFEPFDRYGHRRESAGKTMAQLLDEFEALRVQSLETLKSWKLGEQELRLEGIHPAFGVVSLRQLLSTWVAHDFGHLAQIARVMAKRYREDVGPWREYLPILNR